ncbi:hypothetical protein EK21DRAFT_104688 [Setomelanomma holmii]|uniref:Uncharacterized protein n=1 Tax=Setomelanomma holmii TaxID=210430 RepID=A0A9P4LGH9_9PLEO|nr:hypothetical protein EK21DRAFT_104688 [Setomelanomma holmii]
MAGSNSSSGGSTKLPSTKNEKKTGAINITVNIPRRKLTLVTITLLLNILHYSALACLFTTVWQISVAPKDATSLPSEILTLISIIATFFYTGLHTIISYKQKIWMRQRRHLFAIKRTSYVAIRVAVTLCVLWLQPRRATGLQSWEFGMECRISRASMTFAMINLVASFISFGVLAVIRRPFEANLFRHGFQPPVNPFATPCVSRDTSPLRNASERRLRGSRRSAFTRRSPSIVSDVTTLDLSNSPPPPMIHAPTSSLDKLPPVFRASASHPALTLPPRLAGAVSLTGIIPLFVAPQFSASTWKALRPSTFSYHGRYSRSSVSLTRPHRLSTTTPAGSVDWTSQSGSTGPEGRDTPGSEEDNADRRASAQDTAFATLNGLPVPGTTRPKTRGNQHSRTASAPDATLGAEEPPQTDRMAMGWKPQLVGQRATAEEEAEIEAPPAPTKLPRIVRSSSADLLSRFSPDTSPDNDDKTPRRELEYNIDAHARVMKELPFRRSRSDSYLGNSDADATVGASSFEQAAAAMVGNMPLDLKLGKNVGRTSHSEEARKRDGGSEGGGSGVLTYEQLKNKPLPNIAVV